MKEITVHNQQEFDKITDQIEDTRIIIDSPAESWPEITMIPKNCYVVAWDSSHVVAWDSSHVVAWDSSHVEAWERTTVTKQSKDISLKLHGNALLQDASQELKFTTLKEWLAWWDVTPTKGKLRMYKAIQPNGTDFYTGKIHYEIGKTIECPDWLEDYPEECGHGFHCSPQLFLTDGYAGAKEHIHIAVEIAIKDIRLPKILTMPDKLRVKKLKVLQIIKEE